MSLFGTIERLFKQDKAMTGLNNQTIKEPQKNDDQIEEWPKNSHAKIILA
ncbi:hypothetical protein HGG82_06010 [Marinomonas sp. M1K-6]|uniref:Uncharacterized protein n=1 Tax=Marinomonas profundi TaxID=2726122 RepID=A0A847QXI3_9GAMM|nr:hypothetical protein [Marinomonas profundi]NLQ17179.1 hypothetical protein [Marinomonas profundi]UDV04628.1 hypothetical protein J8N69_07760 [Marinomonas profundi]